MSDDGKIHGAASAKKLMELLPNLIRDTLGIIADVDLLSENHLDYIKISVSPSPYPINYKEEYHYRSGSTKQELKGSALSQFLLKKTGLTWDSVTIPNTDITSFRNDAFDIFREQAITNNRMSQKELSISITQLAEKLGLIEDNQTTRAGILTFHHNPEKWITGAWVKIGFFSSDATIEYMDEIHGSLLQQAIAVIDLLYTKYLRAPVTFEGITRIEKYPYPKDAVREAVLNAIVHKNYSRLTPIQIRVYADKLRIVNDSILPEGVSADQLLNENISRPANPKIANAFYRAGFIESWGRGIQEIREIYHTNGCKPPVFEVSADTVSVTFVSPQADSVETILDFCKIARSRDEIQTFLKLNHREHFRTHILNPLVEKGLLIQTQPDKPTSPNQKYITCPEYKKERTI